MALVCAQCSRVNPADAAYCYNDGVALAGRAGGPINPAAMPFPTPFVFPNGKTCRNLDQLAMACELNWTAAVHLMKQGVLAAFFGGIGRGDLAAAAQEAAQYPDPDRGLDQLLGKIPSKVVEPPRLHAEPAEINLGQVAAGSNRTAQLHLSNRGMRLLYGSVATGCKWLTLGDAPGQPAKVFQFGSETIIPLQIRGEHLRAGARPQEGQLFIESNGGSVTVIVRADVPITPFAGGLFDGATTPRQIAEKAKTNPKEAGPYFEDGRIATWFQKNGWTYPVQGPPMSGIGAVQQFFEALGVAKPPKIEVSPPWFQFEGEPNTVCHANLEVETSERKVVYAWATTNCAWVAVGESKLSGRKAIIPIAVAVPDRAGTHHAELLVFGNGKQRFTVSIAVTVIGGAHVADDDSSDSADVVVPEVSEPTPGPQLPAKPPGAPRHPPISIVSDESSAGVPSDASVAAGYPSEAPVAWPKASNSPTPAEERYDEVDPDRTPRRRDGDENTHSRSSRYDDDDATTDSARDRNSRRRLRRQPTGMSVASLVLGVVGLGVSLFSAGAGTIVGLGCCCGVIGAYAGLSIGAILGIIAVILGLVGMNQGAKGFAYTGIATGAVNLLLVVAYVVVTVIFGVAFFALIANHPPPPRRF